MDEDKAANTNRVSYCYFLAKLDLGFDSIYDIIYRFATSLPSLLPWTDRLGAVSTNPPMNAEQKPSLLKAKDALFASVKSGVFDALEKALAAGADIRTRTVSGDTLLNMILDKERHRTSVPEFTNRLDFAWLLVDKGVPLTGESGARALKDAIGLSRSTLLLKLFTARIDKLQPDTWKDALVIAARHEKDPKDIDHVCALDTLLQLRLPVDSPGSTHMSPLAWAIASNKPVLISKLLRAGANPNFAPPEGLSPMQAYWASYQERAPSRQTLESLLAAGGDLNIVSDIGYTGLMLAAAFEDEEVAILLLEKGADPTISAPDGRTAYSSYVEAREGKAVPASPYTDFGARLLTATSDRLVRKGVDTKGLSGELPPELATPPVSSRRPKPI